MKTVLPLSFITASLIFFASCQKYTSIPYTRVDIRFTEDQFTPEQEQSLKTSFLRFLEDASSFTKESAIQNEKYDNPVIKLRFQMVHKLASHPEISTHNDKPIINKYLTADMTVTGMKEYKFPLSAGVVQFIEQQQFRFDEEETKYIFSELVSTLFFQKDAQKYTPEQLAVELSNKKRMETEVNKYLTLISLAGESRCGPCSANLIEMMQQNPHSVLAYRIIGALSLIKDPKAVNPLIELGREQAPHLLKEVIYAIASIGGEEAQGFLFTISTGHPNPDVRQIASTAIAHYSNE